MPANVETVRIGKLRGIAVGGADADMDEGAARHGDAAEHRVRRRATVAELVRAFHAQELLHRGLDQFGIGAQIAHGVGIADQEIDAIADEIGRGLVSGVENEDAVVQELELGQVLFRPAARRQVGGGDQLGQDLALVVALLAHAPFDEIVQIALEVVDRRGAARELLGGQHRLERAEDRQRPVAQRPAFVGGHAQHVADELQRDRRGKIRDQVHAALRGGAIEQPVDQRLDARLQRLQRPGCEGRRQELAHPAVVGRIVEDEAGRVVLVERARAEVGPEIDLLVRAPGLGIAIDGRTVVVAAEEI